MDVHASCSSYRPYTYICHIYQITFHFVRRTTVFFLGSCILVSPCTCDAVAHSAWQISMLFVSEICLFYIYIHIFNVRKSDYHTYTATPQLYGALLPLPCIYLFSHSTWIKWITAKTVCTELNQNLIFTLRTICCYYHFICSYIQIDNRKVQCWYWNVLYTHLTSLQTCVGYY